MAAETKKEEPEMEYRMMGGTGLKVSTLSFGFWATYGVKEGMIQYNTTFNMMQYT